MGSTAACPPTAGVFLRRCDSDRAHRRRKPLFFADAAPGRGLIPPRNSGVRMKLLRHAALATALLMAGPTVAADVSMANGAITFSTPDNWMGIMETQGDPE